MRKLAVVLVALAAATPGLAEEKSFTWDSEGYASILGAATKAKTTGARLLLGLSGSPS